MTLAVFKKVGYYYNARIGGHAGGAANGSDIVCAGVSALVYALMETVHDKPEVFLDADIVYNDGLADVAFHVEPWNEGLADMMIDTIRTGFELMMERYPDNVRVEW